MKANATGSNPEPVAPDRASDCSTSTLTTPYTRVLDGRKSPVRGLWKRGERFYARLTTTETQTGRKKLAWIKLDAQTVPQAQAEMRRLVTRRQTSSLPTPKQAPKFNEYVTTYLDYHTKVSAKRPSTVATERANLTSLIRHFGETRLHQITLPMVRDWMAKRQTAGLHARTINLGITVLRNVLKRAREDGWLTSLPEWPKPLKYTTERKALLTAEQIEKLCAAAMAESKNGPQFCDYVRLMAYSGARRNEALQLRWVDVDFDRRQLTIAGETKNYRARTVDFNEKLEALLRQMHTRRAPDSRWLFPSPQRGDKDIHALTFMETLRLARTKANLPEVGFHHLRHYFASYCVMSGVDFMTTAAWLGHSDGGILIGKVYGHLAAEHKQALARQLRFEPIVLAKEATA